MNKGLYPGLHNEAMDKPISIRGKGATNADAGEYFQSGINRLFRVGLFANDNYEIQRKSGSSWVSTLSVNPATGALTLAGLSIAASSLTYNGVAIGNPTGTGNMVLSASPTLTGTLSAGALNLSGLLTIAGLGSNFIGGGGTGVTPANMFVNGGSGAAGGGAIFFQKNSVTKGAGIANHSAASGSGTSDDFVIWNVASGPSLRVNATTGDVTIPNNTASSSTTTGALVVTGGVGIGGNLRVGGSGLFGAASAGSSSKLEVGSLSSALTTLSWYQAGIAEWWMGMASGSATLQIGSATAGTGAILSINGTTQFYPESDNTVSNGLVGKRWTAVYAVNGTIQTSDERRKIVLGDSDLGLDFIRAIRPMMGRYKEDDENVRRYFIGAQQVLRVLDGRPFNGIIKDHDGSYGANYSEFITPLISSVQSLAYTSDSHETRIAALEKLAA
jgi:hypothetical protein